MTRHLFVFLLLFSFLIAGQHAHALMTPDGQMVQMKEYDQSVELVESKDYRAAIKKLTAILREEPRHANAWNLLGFSQRMTGDFDSAERAYDNALLITPNHLGALNYKGQMYVQTGRMEQAREMLTKLQTACNGTCEEYAQLKKAVEEGKAGNY